MDKSKIGTKLKTFIKYCQKNNIKVRVIKENDVDYIITDDLHLDRFNLEIENGIITNYSMG